MAGGRREAKIRFGEFQPCGQDHRGKASGRETAADNQSHVRHPAGNRTPPPPPPQQRQARRSSADTAQNACANRGAWRWSEERYLPPMCCHLKGLSMPVAVCPQAVPG